MSSKVPRPHKEIQTTPSDSVNNGKLIKAKDASKKKRISSGSSKPRSVLSAAVGIKKPHRFRPGTLANIEIRRYQGPNSPDLLIPKAHIFRMTKALMGEIGDYRLTREALRAIREAVDAEAVRVLASANRMAIHAGRVTIMPKDFDAVTDVRLIYPDPGMKNKEHSQRYLAARQERLQKSLKLLTRRRETLKNRVTELTSSVQDDDEPPVTSDSAGYNA